MAVWHDFPVPAQTVSARIIVGDCLESLRELPDASVQMCCTSPPYYGLRDYGHAAQLGLEKTPAEYVEKMVRVFRELRRVLRADGTLWLNIGDSYNAQVGQRKATDKPGPKQATSVGSIGAPSRSVEGCKPKDLIGVPWMLAFALRADGWYLRSDIIWHKPNPMPESVTDRPTKSHEYVFLLSKNASYFYDAEAIAGDFTESSIERLSQPTLDIQAGSDRVPGKTNGAMKAVGKLSPHMVGTPRNDGDRWRTVDGGVAARGKRNARSVWTITTQPYKGAHFATMPPELARRCILAGSAKQACEHCGKPWERQVERETINKEGWGRATKDHHAGVDGAQGFMRDGMGRAGDSRSVTLGFAPSCDCGSVAPIPSTVLDPFGGAGTTGLVADRLGRDAILIEINEKYAELARHRITDDAPLFTEVA